jgi:hypothetical protein
LIIAGNPYHQVGIDEDQRVAPSKVVAMGGDGIAVDRLVLVDLVLPRAQDRVEPLGIEVAQPRLRARGLSFSITTSRTASVKLPRLGWQ